MELAGVFNHRFRREHR